MKKTLYCLLAVCLLILVTGCGKSTTSSNGDADKGALGAQTFVLRDNVMFGMTMDQVTSTEAGSGLKCEVVRDNLLSVQNCIVAGAQDTTIQYFFDENGKLVQLIYIFHREESNSVRISAYNEIESGLKSKYGSTQFCDSTGKMYRTVAEAHNYQNWVFDNTNIYVAQYGYYSQRVVSFDNGDAVCIEHEMEYSPITGNVGTEYLTYTYVPEFSTKYSDNIKMGNPLGDL